MLTRLTADNYSQGFLIDEELMAGVAAQAQSQGFMAFVLRHTTGEYLGYQACGSLDEALELINRIPRGWSYESSSGCDGSRCAPGKCKGAGCKIYAGPQKAQVDDCVRSSRPANF